MSVFSIFFSVAVKQHTITYLNKLGKQRIVGHWPFSHQRTNKSSGRTNRLRQANRLICKRNEQIFRRTNRLIFGHLERRFFQDDLPMETNKSTTLRHKFTSDGQMPGDLTVQTICSSSSVKIFTLEELKMQPWSRALFASKKLDEAVLKFRRQNLPIC